MSARVYVAAPFSEWRYPRTLEVVSRGGGTLHYKSSDTVLVKGEEEVLSRPQCPHCGLKHLHHDQCGHR